MEYVNPTFVLLWAAALAAILAVAHSAIGERMLVGPLTSSDSGVMADPLYCKVARIAWHWTSVLWLLVAAALAFAAYGEIDAPWLVLAIGIAHLAIGLFDLGWTRGRHVTGVPVALVGALVCLATYATQNSAI